MSLSSMNFLAEAERIIDQEFDRYVKDEVVPVLKSCTPAKTGHLRDSIHAEKISDNMYWVGTNMYYGKYVQSGRDPVFPVVKQALYWPDIQGGRPVRSAGPAKAQHVVEKAIAKLGG